LGRPEPYGKMKFRCMRGLKGGSASGQITGGNLTRITESIGTPYEVITEGRILFLEEVEESEDGIIASLRDLKSHGKFDGVRGMVFGRMANCFSGEETFRSKLGEVLSGIDCPVVYDIPSGHTEDLVDEHITLPFGLEISLDAEKASIDINEPAVS